MVLCLLSLQFVKAQDTPNTKGVIVAKGNQTTNPVKGDTYAIIVGVSNYPGIQPLKYADKDALLFRDFLQTPAGGNTKKENIFILINDSAKAASFNVKAYGWLKRKALKPGDRLYIFFSGHGDAMNVDNYFFLPYDCAPSQDDNNYLGTGNINMHSVKTLFIKPLTAKGVEVLLIVDACRTNELPGGEEGQKNFATYVQAIAEQRQGEIIMLSTGAGQVSIESPQIGNGHGLFTWYLIDGLSGLADKEGDAADNDGVVSLSEISSFVKNRVKRDAKSIFKTDQVPYFCCQEKDLETIAVVDSSTYHAWLASKNLRKLTGNDNLFDVAKKKQGTKGAAENNDTALIALYNKFIDAQKDGALTGKNSAEDFYTRMEKKWPGNDITEEAKYTLAAEFINFGQQKINLFLNGKGITYVNTLEEQYKKTKKDNSSLAGNDKNTTDSVQLPPGVAEQVTKMKALAITGFDVAAEMTEKAIRMLKNEPELLEPVYAKYYFLKAQAVNEKNDENVTDINEALRFCRMAINKDTTAAYNFYLMGSLLRELKNDSAVYYFQQAVRRAPRWAYPVNGLGNYYSSKNNEPLAIEQYKKAVELDTLFANGWQNIGSIYHNMKEPDSAKKYYAKALAIDPCNVLANANLGSLYRDSLDVEESYAALAFGYLQKAIECDSSVGFAYKKIAELYSVKYQMDGEDRYLDSSLYFLERCTKRNPKYSHAYAATGDIYLTYNKDTAKATNWYKKAYQADTLNADNIIFLANFYGEIGYKDSLDILFKKAIAARPADPDLYNTIGNYYKNSWTGKDGDSMAKKYYYQALRLNPDLAYVNYNLGVIYYGSEVKTDVDSCSKYYQRAASLDPIQYNKQYRTIADLYAGIKNTDSAIYYYDKCLALGLYDYRKTYFIDQLTTYLLLKKRFTDAEDRIKKYVSTADFNNHFRLRGLVAAAAGKQEEAEIFFVRATTGMTEKDATNHIKKTYYSYPFQSRFPDKDGLLTGLYSSLLLTMGIPDSLIQVTINKKVQPNSSYIFPYSHAMSLTDKELYNGTAVDIVLSAIMNSNKKDTSNSYKWILRSLIDRYKRSFRENKKWKINYPVPTLWPASYTKDFKETGSIIITKSTENRKELLKDLVNAAQKDSTNARLYTAIGDLHILLIRDAVDILLSSINKDKVEEKLDSAIKNHYTHAVSSYTLAVDVDKNFGPVVLCKMGDFYSLAGKTKEARQCFLKAVAADTSFIYPLVKLGNFYQNSLSPKSADTALYYYQRVLRIDSDFEPFNFTMANIYFNKGEPDKAAAYYHRAFRLDPASVSAATYLANFYHETGKRDSALFYFSKTVKAFKKTPDYFMSEMFFVVTALADSLHFPQECGEFFKAGLDIPAAWSKADQSTRNECDIEYYWQYARYSCSINDTAMALQHLRQMLTTLKKQNDKLTARSKYDKIPTDKYLAAIREVPAFLELMTKYPFSEIDKKEYLNIR